MKSLSPLKGGSMAKNVSASDTQAVPPTQAPVFNDRGAQVQENDPNYAKYAAKAGQPDTSDADGTGSGSSDGSGSSGGTTTGGSGSSGGGTTGTGSSSGS